MEKFSLNDHTGAMWTRMIDEFMIVNVILALMPKRPKMQGLGTPLTWYDICPDVTKFRNFLNLIEFIIIVHIGISRR